MRPIVNIFEPIDTGATEFRRDPLFARLVITYNYDRKTPIYDILLAESKQK